VPVPPSPGLHQACGLLVSAAKTILEHSASGGLTGGGLFQNAAAATRPPTGPAEGGIEDSGQRILAMTADWPRQQLAGGLPSYLLRLK